MSSPTSLSLDRGPSPASLSMIQTLILDPTDSIESYTFRIISLSKSKSKTASSPAADSIKMATWISRPCSDLLSDCYQSIFTVALDPEALPSNQNKKVIAKMFGHYIDRELFASIPRSKIRASGDDFLVASLRRNIQCTEIFDLEGMMKRELCQGGRNEGRGVWGQEVNDGAIFVVDWVFVSKEWRGRGLGDVMFTTLLHKAQEINGGKGYRFAIVEPGTIIQAPSSSKRPTVEDQDVVVKDLEVAKIFYLKHGFRRVGTSETFARATGRTHPSRNENFGPEIDFEGDEMLLAEEIPGETETSEAFLCLDAIRRDSGLSIVERFGWEKDFARQNISVPKETSQRMELSEGTLFLESLEPKAGLIRAKFGSANPFERNEQKYGTGC